MVSFYIQLLNIFKGICLDSTSAISWLSTPISAIGMSPLAFISISGLTVFIPIAIAKWLIS